MSIKNIVVSATATEPIDIDFIELMLTTISKRNKCFGSLNVKMFPSTLCQLFPNGKIIVIGGTTEEEVKDILHMYLRHFANLGHPISYKDYRIQNIVSCYKHDKTVDLTPFSIKHKLEYEPELFPAVRYKCPLTNVTVNIFRSGSCVILGAKSVDSLNQTLYALKSLLEQCITK